MQNIERLSRKDRRRWRISYLFSLIFGLLVLVAAYLAVKIYWEPEIAPKKVKPIIAPTVIDFHSICDSLIVRAYSGFGLSDQIHLGQMEQNRAGGGAYRSFSQGWPEELPYVAFAKELNELASQDSISCDCQELSREKKLDCFLVSGGAIGARIILKADAATKFEGRELTLVYENFTSLSADVITSLLKSGMAFSYIAGPETTPTSKVRELLSKRGVTAILRLPASEGGWRKISGIIRQGKGEVKKASSGKIDKPLIDKVFERHPTTKLLYFDFSGQVDWGTVERVIERAKTKKIALLLSANQPQEIISIAGKAGIQVFQAKLDSTLERKPLSQLKNDIMRVIISGKSQKRLLAFPDSNGLKLENLWLFKTYFEKLGVKFRPLMKLVEPFDSPHATLSQRVDCELAEGGFLEVGKTLFDKCPVIEPRAKPIGQSL